MTTSPSANPITSPANPEAPPNQSNELLDPTLAPQDQAPASEPHEATLAPGPQEVQDPPAPQQALTLDEGVPGPASDPHEVTLFEGVPAPASDPPQDQAPASVPHENLALSEAALAPGPQEIQDPSARQEALVTWDGVLAANGPLARVWPEPTVEDSHSPCMFSSFSTLFIFFKELSDTCFTFVYSHPAPKEAQIMRDGVQVATVDDSHSPCMFSSFSTLFIFFKQLSDTCLTFVHSHPAPKEAQIMRDGVQVATVDDSHSPCMFSSFSTLFIFFKQLSDTCLTFVHSHPAPKEAQIMRDGVQVATVDDSHSPCMFSSFLLCLSFSSNCLTHA
jgi:hypothetical protein